MRLLVVLVQTQDPPMFSRAGYRDGPLGCLTQTMTRVGGNTYTMTLNSDFVGMLTTIQGC